MPEETQETPDWGARYEELWQIRASFMRDLIAGGESDRFRVISRLHTHERRYGCVVVDGATRWVPRPFNGPMPSGTPLSRPSSLRGHFMAVPFYTVYAKEQLILDYLETNGPFDCLVELGCGYGQNLFSIHAQGGPDIPYFGGEYTDSGVTMARELAALPNGGRFTFFHFDHRDPDLAAVPRTRRAMVFTCHTIEQVRSIPVDWFRTVGSIADEVHCLHLEPFGFQMERAGPISEKQRESFAVRGWNGNMAGAAQEAGARGDILITALYTEMTFPEDPENPPSLMIWRTP
jgi:hypothetical protein